MRARMCPREGPQRPRVAARTAHSSTCKQARSTHTPPPPTLAARRARRSARPIGSRSARAQERTAGRPVIDPIRRIRRAARAQERTAVGHRWLHGELAGARCRRRPAVPKVKARRGHLPVPLTTHGHCPSPGARSPCFHVNAAASVAQEGSAPPLSSHHRHRIQPVCCGWRSSCEPVEPMTSPWHT